MPCQDPVAHQLDDTAIVLRHQRLNDIFVPGLERGQGAGLIDSHHATVADHIGSQDCGKATLSGIMAQTPQEK
jgi:hypothetical protein